MDNNIYKTYVDILEEELVPAMGCTEPIALAYAAALARKTLGAKPEKAELTVSGNIIKNVKSVIVPHTGGKRGMQAAVAVGICCGDAEAELNCLSNVTDDMLGEMNDFLENNEITIAESDAKFPFDIQLKVIKGSDYAYIRIVANHTNVVIIEKNGEKLLEKPFSNDAVQPPANRQLLSVEKIVDFANEVNVDDIREVLQRQIDYNMAIAEEGVKHSYGANIGKILLKSYGNSVQNRAKAWAAAGSDARMNGCEMPVIINSGSGNQGMTTSIPVVIYARECNVSEDLLFRALALANLVTIHLKTGIGSLSAYCGATSAGAGAGAGICYLYGGGYDEISHTIVNALAINSGMICDGAKASCAAKIASAVEAGLLSWQMNVQGSQFYGGDGIVISGVESTIDAVSQIAREGMRSTDTEIIKVMIKN